MPQPISHQDRDIGTEDLKITDLVKLLQEDKFLIPTFQREFVWRPDQIVKLWDSMYHFYPVGSLLYWETDSYLHTHRKIGGYTFPHGEDEVRRFRDWKYILDGQQRATAIFVAMIGGTGRIEDNEAFDYTLYFDAVQADFLFAHQLEKRKTELRRSGISTNFLIRVRDVPSLRLQHLRTLMGEPGFSQEIERNLDHVQRMFNDYKLSLIRIRGVDLDEVCDIFERINQEGKKLDTVDIIIARTYRAVDPASHASGFYLRDNLDSIRTVLTDQGSRWQEIDDLTLLQMVGVCLRKQTAKDRNPYGITATALANLSAEIITANWNACQKAILDTVKFLTDQQVQGPSMLPYSYLALPICHYFHRNPKPDRDTTRQWFWRHVFRPNPFSTSTEVYDHCERFFGKLEQGQAVAIEPLNLSTDRLIRASYQYNNALSRAVLAFLASQRPLDFSDSRAIVLDNVYLDLRQTPNLHHIYPRSFLAQRASNLPGGFSPDSLMNICFLRAQTNTQISDQNPLDYFKGYARVAGFDRILESHLIPREYIDRDQFRPEDYGNFLQARARLLANKIKQELPKVQVTIA